MLFIEALLDTSLRFQTIKEFSQASLHDEHFLHSS